MSEKLGHQHNSHEQIDTSAEELGEVTRAETVEVRHHETKPENVENIREKIDEQAPSSSEELKKAFLIPEDSEPLPPPSKQLKKVSHNNNLNVIQGRLSGAEKSFSKIVHKPSIDTISEIAGKTLIRPSAILCGGIFTLIGSSYYLFVTKDIGYTYNYFVALLLFIGGFIVGLFIEFIYKVAFKHS